MRKQILFVLLAVCWAASPLAGQIGDLSKRLGVEKKEPLSESKIGAGLKEALQIGTGNAVKLTGRTDGYFKNEAIKILMPEKMRTLEKGLRAVGYGKQVDDFVLSMNRAAERAAPAAKSIFWDAIKQMTFEDARKILSGGDTAATEYFQRTTSEKLAAAFRPIVEKATSEVGVTQKYKELVGRYQSIPFAKKETLDVDQYVVSKALTGLFYMVGEEEKKIRKQPAARATQLLKDVFGLRK
ncbi:MAG: DUF4197 domain-containing protein [Acidobacteria bacterium]|nr:DUF4197 domain-containing protein [Acidobacteriota bacterium]